MRSLTFWERIRVPDYADVEQVRHGTIRVDESKCSKCFLCRAACPAGAITEEGGRPVFKAGEAECIFCGACQAICPQGAVSLERPYRYTLFFKTLDHLEPKLPRL